MIETVQAVEGTICGCKYHSSKYADILGIASLRVWIESHTNEYAR